MVASAAHTGGIGARSLVLAAQAVLAGDAEGEFGSQFIALAVAGDGLDWELGIWAARAERMAWKAILRPRKSWADCLTSMRLARRASLMRRQTAMEENSSGMGKMERLGSRRGWRDTSSGNNNSARRAWRGTDSVFRWF